MISDWRPTASRERLALRAAILRRIRTFFDARDVLEVETPLLCHATITDPHLQSLSTQVNTVSGKQTFYLQTSPEFAMKRLLAAESGPIYQICKAFREDEAGRYHNPEFTMLEWYRPGFDHHRLMEEVDALLQHILWCAPAEKMSYQQLFQTYLNLDPLTASVSALIASAKQQGIEPPIGLENPDRDHWLQLLLTYVIEPQIGQERPLFIYDFPMSQAALACVRETDKVAERFEVYFQGIELANGFHELRDAVIQKARFLQDQEKRCAQQLPWVPYDQYLIDALSSGIPACAGVALGIDRLVMLAAHCHHICEVIAFPIERA